MHSLLVAATGPTQTLFLQLLGERGHTVTTWDGQGPVPAAAAASQLVVLDQGAAVAAARLRAVVAAASQWLLVLDPAAPLPEAELVALAPADVVSWPVAAAEARLRIALAEQRVAREIDREDAHTRLRTSVATQRAILSACPDWIFRLQRDGTFLDFSGATEEGLAAPPTEFLGRKLHEFLPAEVARQQMAEIDTCLRTRTPRTLEYGMTVNGQARRFESRMAPAGPDDVVAVVRDTTGRPQMDLALRDSEMMYRSLFREAPEAVFLLDAEDPRPGRIVAANEKAHECHGYAPGELVGRHIMDIDVPADAGLARERMARLNRGEVLCFEVRHRRKDGSDFPLEVHASQLVLGNRRYVLAFERDLTARKRIEAHMLQAQKLESLGVLAGGIAHDFNNLLVGILGNAALALDQTPADAPVRPVLQRIEGAAVRTAELIRQLLAYSGKGRFVVQAVDLSELVEEMASLLRSAISKKAVLELRMTRGLPRFQADATQVRQVVMNLITNAAEALGDQPGQIALTTGVLTTTDLLSLGAPTAGNLPIDDCVFVEVTDTGSGMDEATQRRMFEPFFTTRPGGRGLGLAAILGIVRGHDGAVYVASTPGAGSRFMVLFPAPAAALPATPGPTPPAAPGRWRASGTILVVDDEELIRELAEAALSECGLTVVTAADGAAALRIFRDDPARFCAVLLDMTMPVMGGAEVHRELRRIRPDVPVILSSGYTEDTAASGDGGPGPVGFLQKPYRPQDLLDAVRRTLPG